MNPNCRACPRGCHCPGGDRCRVQPGYYLLGEDLKTLWEPPPCHSDTIVAELRCGYGGECRPGYENELCATCSEGYYAVSGGICEKCPSGSESATVVIGIAIVFAVIAIVAFALVALVQLSFGRSIGSGAAQLIE